MEENKIELKESKPEEEKVATPEDRYIKPAFIPWIIIGVEFIVVFTIAVIAISIASKAR